MLYIWFLISLVLSSLFTFFNVINTLSMFVLGVIVCFFGQIILWAIPCLVANFFVDVNKDYSKDSKFYRFYMYCILSVLKTVLRYKVTVNGFEKIPEGKFLIISNHRSALDPIIQLWVFRKHNIGFVSKKENIRIPVFGKIMYKCSIISLDREDPRQAIKTITKAADFIKNGVVSMGIYPEGTRNKEAGLLDFKPGAFKIAKKAECPILVVTMKNSEFVMKNAPFKRTLVDFDILDLIGADTVKEHNTKELSEMCRNIMLENLSE